MFSSPGSRYVWQKTLRIPRMGCVNSILAGQAVAEMTWRGFEGQAWGMAGFCSQPRVLSGVLRGVTLPFLLQQPSKQVWMRPYPSLADLQDLTFSWNTQELIFIALTPLPFKLFMCFSIHMYVYVYELFEGPVRRVHVVKVFCLFCFLICFRNGIIWRHSFCFSFWISLQCGVTERMISLGFSFLFQSSKAIQVLTLPELWESSRHGIEQWSLSACVCFDLLHCFV